MALTNRDCVELTDWRRMLHQTPELSGQEVQTARAVAQMLAAQQPDQIITGLGGHGVAAVFNGAGPGPTVLFRCELDALPIHEISDLPHRSRSPGVGHMCGHDGHSAIMAGLARLVGRQRPARGRAVLLFQPAEEVGSGAASVLADPQFGQITPDWAFSLHNMPGLPFAHVSLAAGPVNCASRGLKVHLTGKTSHASVPEAGVSPALCLAELIPALMALGPGGVVVPGFRLITITHVRLGELAFGIAPGEAELWVMLRVLLDADMAALVTQAEALVQAAAAAHGLGLRLSSHEVFAACYNNPEATAHLRRAIVAEGLDIGTQDLPMRGSEDFGLFGAVARSAMFFLGAGVAHPMIHNPDYDFPDGLIDPGVRVFHRVLRDILG